MPLRRLALFLLLCLQPTLAAAQDRVIQSNVSGETLARMCQVERDLELDPCVSFILGVADGLSIGKKICPEIRGWTFVAPRLVRKYIADHPEALVNGAGIVVMNALTEKYPCANRPRA